MARFIKVSLTNRKIVHINVDFISAVTDGDECTLISIGAGGREELYEVRESVSDVMEFITSSSD